LVLEMARLMASIFCHSVRRLAKIFSVSSTTEEVRVAGVPERSLAVGSRCLPISLLE